MRLIDADELKTAFPCGESVRTECVRETIDHMPTIQPDSERFIQNAIDGESPEFEKLPSVKPHWIPCSERLPELDDEVLVTDDRGELRHCIFCTWGETWCGFITYEEGMRIKPVAWMPLPSPYQPEEESE